MAINWYQELDRYYDEMASQEGSGLDHLVSVELLLIAPIDEAQVQNSQELQNEWRRNLAMDMAGAITQHSVFAVYAVIAMDDRIPVEVEGLTRTEALKRKVQWVRNKVNGSELTGGAGEEEVTRVKSWLLFWLGGMSAVADGEYASVALRILKDINSLNLRYQHHEGYLRGYSRAEEELQAEAGSRANIRAAGYANGKVKGFLCGVVSVASGMLGVDLVLAYEPCILAWVAVTLGMPALAVSQFLGFAITLLGCVAGMAAGYFVANQVDKVLHNQPDSTRSRAEG